MTTKPEPSLAPQDHQPTYDARRDGRSRPVGRSTAFSGVIDAAAQQRANRLTRTSDAVVGVHKALFGRGPDRCRTYLAGPDVVVCLIEGGLTVAERRLAGIGADDHVRSARQVAFDAVQDDLAAEVGVILERPVRLLISGIDVVRDVATVTFLLRGDHPAAGIGAPTG